MGNESSSLQKAIKSFKVLEKEKGGWEDIVRTFVDAVPLYEVGHEAEGIRVALDTKNKKVLDVLIHLLAAELSGVIPERNEYQYNKVNTPLKGKWGKVPPVMLLLEAADRVLAAKALYKMLPKFDLTPFVKTIYLAAQERRLDLQLLVMRVTTMIIERVGFKEKKAKSKVKNQGKREQDAKDKFYRDGGVHALVYMLSTFHAGSDPQFVVPLLRVVLSWIGPHAETTPFEAMQQLVEVLPRYYGLLWEWSRSPSPELSIASAAVLRALYFESTPLGVHHWHQTALDWGGFLWHLRRALLPTEKERAPLVRPISQDSRERIQFTHPGARAASRSLVMLCLIAGRVSPRLLSGKNAFTPSLGWLYAVVPRGLLNYITNLSPSHVDPVNGSMGEALGIAEDDASISFSANTKLWWDFRMSAAPKGAKQKAESDEKVKFLWFGAVPRELEGPTSGAGGGGGEAPSGAGSSAEPTLECPNWNALWCMLMGQTAGKAPGACVALPIRELNFRWDVNMAWELAEGLWGEEICLDRQRRTEIRKKGESFWDISTSGGQNMNPPPAVIQPKKGKFELVPLLKFVNDLSNGDKWRTQDQVSDSAVPLSTSKVPAHKWDYRNVEIWYGTHSGCHIVEGIYMSTLIERLEAGNEVQLPDGFVATLASCIATEANPRRKLANLMVLRHLCWGLVADPDKDATTSEDSVFVLSRQAMGRTVTAKDDKRFIEEKHGKAVEICANPFADVEIKGIPRIPAIRGIASESLQDISLLRILTHIVASCNTGIGDVPVAEPLPGADASHCCLLVASHSKQEGPRNGFAVHWQRLWRQEAVLCLRLLAMLPKVAQGFGGEGTGGGHGGVGTLRLLAPLLLVPPPEQRWVSDRPTKSGATALGEANGSEDGESKEGRSSRPSVRSRRDALDAVARVRAWRARERARRECVAGIPEDALVTMGEEIGKLEEEGRDVNLPIAETGNQGADFLLFSGRRVFEGADLSLQKTSFRAGLPQHDGVVDEDLGIVWGMVPSEVLATAAADAMAGAVLNCPALAKDVASPVVAQLVVLGLAQPQWPAVATSLLLLLKYTLPRTPLYAPAWRVHGLYRALLLTASGPELEAGAPKSKIAPIKGRSRRHSTMPGAAPLRTAGGATEIAVGEGLCVQAAELLLTLHTEECDTLTTLETDVTGAYVRANPLAKSSQRPEQGFFRGGPPALPASPHSSSLGSKRLATLYKLLPSGMVELLEYQGPLEFAKVFNSNAYSSETVLWSSNMRSRLLFNLRDQLRPVLYWSRSVRQVAHQSAGGGTAELEGGHSSSSPVDEIQEADIEEQQTAKRMWEETGALAWAPYRPVPCQGGFRLLAPSAFSIPAPKAIRYPELTEEPRISGVYLRSFVASGKGPKNLATFANHLLIALQREAALFCTVHRMLFDAVKKGSVKVNRDELHVDEDGEEGADTFEEQKLPENRQRHSVGGFEDSALKPFERWLWQSAPEETKPGESSSSSEGTSVIRRYATYHLRLGLVLAATMRCVLSSPDPISLGKAAAPLAALAQLPSGVWPSITKKVEKAWGMEEQGNGSSGRRSTASASNPFAASAAQDQSTMSTGADLTEDGAPWELITEDSVKAAERAAPLFGYGSEAAPIALLLLTDPYPLTTRPMSTLEISGNALDSMTSLTFWWQAHMIRQLLLPLTPSLGKVSSWLPASGGSLMPLILSLISQCGRQVSTTQCSASGLPRALVRLARVCLPPNPESCVFTKPAGQKGIDSSSAEVKSSEGAPATSGIPLSGNSAGAELLRSGAQKALEPFIPLAKTHGVEGADGVPLASRVDTTIPQDMASTCLFEEREGIFLAEGAAVTPAHAVYWSPTLCRQVWLARPLLCQVYSSISSLLSSNSSGLGSDPGVNIGYDAKSCIGGLDAETLGFIAVLLAPLFVTWSVGEDEAEALLPREGGSPLNPSGARHSRKALLLWRRERLHRAGKWHVTRGLAADEYRIAAAVALQTLSLAAQQRPGVAPALLVCGVPSIALYNLVVCSSLFSLAKQQQGTEGGQHDALSALLSKSTGYLLHFAPLFQRGAWLQNEYEELQACLGLEAGVPTLIGVSGASASTPQHEELEEWDASTEAVVEDAAEAWGNLHGVADRCVIRGFVSLLQLLCEDYNRSVEDGEFPEPFSLSALRGPGSPAVADWVAGSLCAWLTPGVFKSLAGPQFMETLSTVKPIAEQSVIWDSSKRGRLIRALHHDVSLLIASASIHASASATAPPLLSGDGMATGLARGLRVFLGQEELLEEEAYGELYTDLSTEVVVRGVYVRLYLESGSRLGTTSPSDLADGVLSHIRALLAKQAPSYPLKKKQLSRLTSLTTCLWVLSRTLPGEIAPVVAKPAGLAAVLDLLERNVAIRVRAADEGSKDPLNGMNEEVWLRIALLTIRSLGIACGAPSLDDEAQGSHPLPKAVTRGAAKAAAKHMHALHLTMHTLQTKNLKFEPGIEGDDSGIGSSEPTAVVFTCLEHLVLHAPTKIPECYNQGIVLSALRYFTRTEEPKGVRQAAARLVAACAAVKTVNAEPNPARTFIKGLLWPLFDNSLRESGALSNGGAHPEAMLAAWEEDKATPALEWNGDTRSAVRAFLDKQWDSLNAHRSKVLAKPWSMPQAAEAVAAIDKPYIDSCLIVGDVFVERFNEAPLWKEANMERFLQALVKDLLHRNLQVAKDLSAAKAVVVAMKHVLDAHHSTHGSKAAAACLLALPYKVLPSVDATLVEAVVPVLAALSGQSATVHQAAKLCPVPPVQGGSDSQPLPSSGLTFDSHVSPFDAALCALTAAISHQWKGAMPKAESSAATVLAALLTCCANLCRTSEYAVKAARRSLIHIPALGIVIDACQKKELRSPVAIAAASLLSTYTGSSARHKLALRDVGEWLTGLFLRQNALAQKPAKVLEFMSEDHKDDPDEATEASCATRRHWNDALRGKVLDAAKSVARDMADKYKSSPPVWKWMGSAAASPVAQTNAELAATVYDSPLPEGLLEATKLGAVEENLPTPVYEEVKEDDFAAREEASDDGLSVASGKQEEEEEEEKQATALGKRKPSTVSAAAPLPDPSSSSGGGGGGGPVPSMKAPEARVAQPSDDKPGAGSTQPLNPFGPSAAGPSTVGGVPSDGVRRSTLGKATDAKTATAAATGANGAPSMKPKGKSDTETKGNPFAGPSSATPSSTAAADAAAPSPAPSTRRASGNPFAPATAATAAPVEKPAADVAQETEEASSSTKSAKSVKSTKQQQAAAAEVSTTTASAPSNPFASSSVPSEAASDPTVPGKKTGTGKSTKKIKKVKSKTEKKSSSDTGDDKASAGVGKASGGAGGGSGNPFASKDDSASAPAPAPAPAPAAPSGGDGAGKKPPMKKQLSAAERQKAIAEMYEGAGDYFLRVMGMNH